MIYTQPYVTEFCCSPRQKPRGGHMRYIYVLILLILTWCSSVWAQAEKIRMQNEGIPFFYSDAGNIASLDSSLSGLFVNIKIPFDELQFLKISDTLYQADIELSFLVFDMDDDQIDGKTFREKVRAKNFDQTNSNQIFYTFHTQMDLKPAEYYLLSQVTDLDSKKTGKQKRKIRLRDFSDQKLNISDLILQDRQEITKETEQTILHKLKYIFDITIIPFSYKFRQNLHHVTANHAPL